MTCCQECPELWVSATGLKVLVPADGDGDGETEAFWLLPCVSQPDWVNLDLGSFTKQPILLRVIGSNMARLGQHQYFFFPRQQADGVLPTPRSDVSRRVSRSSEIISPERRWQKENGERLERLERQFPPLGAESGVLQ